MGKSGLSYQARSADAVKAAQEQLELERQQEEERRAFAAAAGAARAAPRGSKPGWGEWVGGPYAARIKALKVGLGWAGPSVVNKLPVFFTSSTLRCDLTKGTLLSVLGSSQVDINPTPLPPNRHTSPPQDLALFAHQGCSQSKP